jgi:hypothetical protein
MMRKLFWSLAAMALLAYAAYAAAVDGTWKGTVDTPAGTFEITLALKADGDQLTGTVQGGPAAEMKIEEGKIDGDKVSFIVNMEFGKLTYAGTVSGDDLKLKVALADGDPMDLNCKRVK